MIVKVNKEEYIKDIVNTARDIGKERAIEIIRGIVATGLNEWYGIHANELIEAIQNDAEKKE